MLMNICEMYVICVLDMCDICYMFNVFGINVCFLYVLYMYFI